MGKTLHILVTCCLEPTRAAILREVIRSLQGPLDAERQKDMIVFDNASSHELPNFDEAFPEATFVRAEENYGYWSAVNWVLNNYKLLLGREFDYVYVIESDMVHSSYPRISLVEEFLDDTPDIGSVRLQEFLVAEAHLYDKTNPQERSRRYAWTRLSNHFTGKKAYFLSSAKWPTVYRTNLAPQVPALNRMSFMREAFGELEKKEKLAEVDFQEVYFRKFSETALLDGGIYDCKLSAASDVMTGSYTDIQKLSGVGYKMTRFDRIVSIAEMRVS